MSTKLTAFYGIMLKEAPIKLYIFTKKIAVSYCMPKTPTYSYYNPYFLFPCLINPVIYDVT